MNMTREQALQAIKAKMDYYESDKRLRAAIETLIPQLRESEDERITRAINNMLPFIPDEAYANNGVTKEDVLNWLEKQKDSVSNAKYIEDIAHAFEDERKKGIEEKQKPGPISCSHEKGTPAEVCYGPKGDPDPAGVWKPSEEQMEALKAVIDSPTEYRCIVNELKPLYDELKKL